MVMLCVAVHTLFALMAYLVKLVHSSSFLCPWKTRVYNKTITEIKLTFSGNKVSKIVSFQLLLG